MITVTSKSWTTVLVVAIVGLSVLLASSPEAREQAQQGAAHFGEIMVQLFIGLGDLLRSILHVDVNFG